MAITLPKLRISTPTEPILPGRGFYQLEEDSLYVQVGFFSGTRHFFSFLESSHVRFEIDSHGHLIFIEYSLPRRQWRVAEPFSHPQVVEPADIRWLDFREQITEPTPLTNTLRTDLLLQFQECEQTWNYYLGDSVVLQVDNRDNLAGIWISGIIDDLAGQEISFFRKKLRNL